MADAAQKGIMKRAAMSPTRIALRGSRNGQSKLTEELVRQIRAEWRFYKHGLADRFGVDRTTILDVVKRKTWAHIA
jgi:hypothetical protein